MPQPAPKTELLRSLGRMTRGLSALFWGLPLALVLCVQTASTGGLGAWSPLGAAGPAFAFALLTYGLSLLSGFQPQERPWASAVERAQLLAITCLGLSPFLYWHHRLPEVGFFEAFSIALVVAGLLLLLMVNGLLRRLAAMLPDETLRLETRLFTRLNTGLILSLPAIVLLWNILVRWPDLPLDVRLYLRSVNTTSPLFLLLVALMPFAITMSLLWKIKEAILESAFSEDSPPPSGG